ncbi:MAG TPA: regulatory iron-sulfur-containing complex subunit RicT, partial [Gemmatimonadaceae bacterium]|nr:regulatory iron-sulfur-containing complex subunit RicT [Gemmatimonadaceae bacterium]
MSLIEISFKGNRKEFFHWPGDEPPPLRAPMIVVADRGEDLGLVHAVGELAERRYEGAAHGRQLEPATKAAIRLATPEEHARARELREVHDEQARRTAMERVRSHNLVMKLTDAEWQWDRRKLTIYFTAERRVDFRALVRDLASTFRARIELKQIGVRDEAKRLDGIGRCGRQYCSASWLPELRPVNLGVAKEQHLSLNPSQISGACGRLMCCLRYEHEFYVQSRKRFPKEGRILVSAVGEEKVLATDIFRDRVTLRNAEGDVRVVALADLKRELSETPPEMAAASDDAEPGAAALVTLARRATPAAAPAPAPAPAAAAEPPAPAEDAAVAVVPPRAGGGEASESADRAGSGEGAASDQAGSEERRRRRRGRRGGRRGRGGQAGTEPDAGQAEIIGDASLETDS